MTCMLDLPQRAGLARQLLLAGAAMLTLAGNTLAQTPVQREMINRTLIVADSVQRVGDTIAGGWREC